MQPIRRDPKNVCRMTESVNEQIYQLLKTDIYMLKMILLFWEGMICNYYYICQLFFCSKIDVTVF